MSSAARSIPPPATGHWDFPRSVAGLSVLVDFGERHGVQRSRVLAGLDLGGAAGELPDPSTLVPARSELAALRNLAEALGDREALGLELGACYHVTSFGILGYALMSSRTVLDAIDLTLRFIDLSHIFTSPHARLEPDHVVLTLHAKGLPVDLERFLVERDVAAIHTVLTELLPGGVPFSRVELAFPAPENPRPFLDLLGVAPEFGATRTTLRFATSHLDRELPQANPHSQALAETMCRDVVSATRRRSGVTEDVRRWITGNVAYDAGMGRAAAALAMSPRTLRRRLAEAGTGYQQLLDEVRQALAEEMLATGVLTVEDVAQRLGYAEASSFIHAFKRWRGMTPARFQRSDQDVALDRDPLHDQRAPLRGGLLAGGAIGS